MIQRCSVKKSQSSEIVNPNALVKFRTLVRFGTFQPFLAEYTVDVDVTRINASLLLFEYAERGERTNPGWFDYVAALKKAQ